MLQCKSLPYLLSQCLHLGLIFILKLPDMKKQLLKLSLLACFFLITHTGTFAQLTTAAGGGNKKAAVSEQIGLTSININYDRPGVKGREGQVWGKLVHVG